ncbi:MAG: TonB-dependent receptor domain-containing protein [Candidatus Acidiferrales bacterium]
MRAFLRFLLLRFFLVLGFSFTFTVAGLAQSQATLTGFVVDASGAGISGARVVATPVGQDKSAGETTTTAEGRFTLALAAGKFKIRVTRETFAAGEAQVDLAAGQTHDVRIALALEPLSSSVVVTAAAEPVTTAAASTPVSILTRADIENQQQVSLVPLLASLPGVSFAQLGREGGVTSLFLDGGNSNFTKVLIDGVPVNEPGGAIDLSNISLDDVDKIEVVHGAESGLFGSDAVDGAVQIFTHRGMTTAPELNLESDGGTFSTAHGSADLSGMLGRFDYSAGGAYFTTAGQGVNDGFLNRTLSGNFGYAFSDRDTLRFILRDNSSNAGAPGQTLYEPPILGDHDDLHNFVAGFVWDFATGAHWEHRFSFGNSSIHELYAYPPYNTVNQYNRADSEWQSSYLFRNGAVTAGYEYEVENGYPGDLYGEHARRNNQAGYLDARWSPWHRVIFNAGFRVEDNSNFGTRGVPRAGVLFTLRYGGGFFGATRALFSYGQGIKEPSLDESFGTDPCYPGNPYLKPEQSQTYEVGVEQRLANDRVEISANYFYDGFQDMITFGECEPGESCPVTTPPSQCPFGVGTYFNTDLAVSRGARLAATARPEKWLSITGNYTYDNSRVIAAPNAYDPTEELGNRLLRRPVESGNVIVNATFRRMNWNLATRFVGVRTDSDFLYPPLGLTRDPGYVLVNLAASYRISREAEFIGRVENLFNEFYQGALGYPGYHRGYSVGLHLTIGKE